MSFCSNLISGCSNALSSCGDVIGSGCSFIGKGCKKVGSTIYAMDDKTFKILASADLMIRSACQGRKTEFALGTVQLIRGVALAATTVATIGLFAGGASFMDVANGKTGLSESFIPGAEILFPIGLSCNTILETATAVTCFMFRTHDPNQPLTEEIAQRSVAIQRAFNKQALADLIRLGPNEIRDRFFNKQFLTALALAGAYAFVTGSIGFAPYGIQAASAIALSGVKLLRYGYFNVRVLPDAVRRQSETNRNIAANSPPPPVRANSEFDPVGDSEFGPIDSDDDSKLELGEVHHPAGLFQHIENYDRHAGGQIIYPSKGMPVNDEGSIEVHIDSLPSSLDLNELISRQVTVNQDQPAIPLDQEPRSPISKASLQEIAETYEALD